MAKYHINEEHLIYPCTATKRPCKFGGEDAHFNTRAEAHVESEKRFAKHFAGITKSLKRNPMPLPQQRVSTFDDLSELTPAERAQVMVFEAMKRTNDLVIGSPQTNYYIGPGNHVDNEMLTNLMAIGAHAFPVINKWNENVNLRGPRTIAELEDDGFKVDLILNTLKEISTRHWEGTLNSEDLISQNLTAEVVITNPQGISLQVPVTCLSDFKSLLEKVVKHAKNIEDIKNLKEIPNLIIKKDEDDEGVIYRL
jgi:hypothetical protein